MRTLADLDLGESARLTQLLLPDDIAEIVSEAGFIPGAVVMLRTEAAPAFTRLTARIS
jgi:hypothetical protein